MKIQLVHSFKEIISVENLLDAWKEFIRGKRSKQDVQEFQLHLMDRFDHRVLRTATKRRMMKKIQKQPSKETLTLYLGLLQHGNTYVLREKIISS